MAANVDAAGTAKRESGGQHPALAAPSALPFERVAAAVVGELEAVAVAGEVEPYEVDAAGLGAKDDQAQSQ